MQDTFTREATLHMILKLVLRECNELSDGTKSYKSCLWGGTLSKGTNMYPLGVKKGTNMSLGQNPLWVKKVQTCTF